MASVQPAPLLLTLMLAGCAGEQLGLTTAEPSAPQAFTGMTGRWMLSAPNAPACGMSFGGAPGATEGPIRPEGGCPGRFFMSRHWALDGNTLTIKDDEKDALGTLVLAGDRFEGQAVTGIPVALAR